MPKEVAIFDQATDPYKTGACFILNSERRD